VFAQPRAALLLGSRPAPPPPPPPIPSNPGAPPWPTPAAPPPQPAALPSPPEAAPPADPELRREVEGLAAMVARSGPAMEDLARRQAAASAANFAAAAAADAESDGGRGGREDGERPARSAAHPRYRFFVTGEGLAYYLWRLHRIRVRDVRWSSLTECPLNARLETGVDLSFFLSGARCWREGFPAAVACFGRGFACCLGEAAAAHGILCLRAGYEHAQHGRGSWDSCVSCAALSEDDAAASPPHRAPWQRLTRTYPAQRRRRSRPRNRPRNRPRSRPRSRLAGSSMLRPLAARPRHPLGRPRCRWSSAWPCWESSRCP
jgi:hypothetical protein